MNYQKNTWSYGDLITQAKMNNIEEGISNAVEAINSIPKNLVQSVNGNLPDKDGNIQISLGEDADALLAAHNSDATAHEDIRSSINEINTEIEQLKTKYPEGGGGNCSCPTGTIEKETKIEYTMTEVPSVSCDFLDGAKLYKLSDTTFSKEELLLSEWTVQVQGHVANITWSESDIIINTEDILMAAKDEDGSIIVICYKSGEITVEIDTDLIATVNIPEVGLYVLNDPEVIEYLLGMQIIAKATIIEEVNFVQSNWNQNDQTKPDYIKNKPKELSEEMLLAWLNEEKIVSPLASMTGEVYTTNNNEIYIL